MREEGALHNKSMEGLQHCRGLEGRGAGTSGLGLWLGQGAGGGAPTWRCQSGTDSSAVSILSGEMANPSMAYLSSLLYVRYPRCPWSEEQTLPR